MAMTRKLAVELYWDAAPRDTADIVRDWDFSSSNRVVSCLPTIHELSAACRL